MNKNILKTLGLLIAISLFGFAFSSNEQIASGAFYTDAGFNVTVTGCSGSTATVRVYLHGSTTNPVSSCFNNTSNMCTASMCNFGENDYDIYGDNGACAGWLYKVHWPGGCSSHLDETINCASNGCYGPGH